MSVEDVKLNDETKWKYAIVYTSAVENRDKRYRDYFNAVFSTPNLTISSTENGSKEGREGSERSAEEEETGKENATIMIGTPFQQVETLIFFEPLGVGAESGFFIA